MLHIFTGGAKLSLQDLSVSQLAYYIAFGLYSIACFLGHTTFEAAFGISKEVFTDGIQAIVLVLLFARFLSQRASFGGWIVAIVIVIIGFVSWRQSGEGWLFWLALFVVCSGGVSIRALAGITLCINALMLFVTIVCAVSGVIENPVAMRQGVARQGLGFAHPNSLGLSLLMICISFSALRLGKAPLPDIALIVVAVAVNLATADSRTFTLFAALQIVLLLVFYFARTPIRRQKVFILCGCIVAVAVFASFYFMVFYDSSNPFHAALNSMLSGRLRLVNGYYQMQPLTLFGSDFSQFAPIYWEDGESFQFVVDNAFCHLVLRYGIVPTMVFFIGLLSLAVRFTRNQRLSAALFGITLMLAYGFSETFGIRVECNFFLVVIGAELLFGGNCSALGASGTLDGSERVLVKP